MRINSAAYLFKQGIRNIWNNRIMSLASFCIMTVSLLIVGFAVLFFANINTFIGNVEDKNEVIIFISDDAGEEYITELGEKLKSMDNVSSVSFYSKEEAFEDIKKDMTDAEDIFSYLGDESPLPDAYRIRIADIEKMSSTLMMINSLDHIEKVKAPYDFVSILRGLKTITTIVAGIILTALVLVSFVIISNTTRASVDMRKREISIMKYVGATNFFIKVPFFVEGLVMGICAGAVAALFTFVGYDSIVELLSSETVLFNAMGISGFIPIEGFIGYITVGYIAVGAVISAVGTVLSTRKYVRV